MLKSKPKQKDLEKIKKKVGDKWRSLLTNLGEEEATIQGFLGDCHGSTTEACFKGLAHWLGGNADGPVTWETLLKALKESELKGFADDLEKELIGCVFRHRLHTIICTYTLTRVHALLCRANVCILVLRLVRSVVLMDCISIFP